MFSGKITQEYTRLEAWLHDSLIAERALNVHWHLLEQGQLTDILAQKRERKVLDVGCGGGQAAIRLKTRFPHLRLTGIDLSESQIARAQFRAQRQGLSVQFEVANAQALPYANEDFDVVYSFGSVKHWPDVVSGIAECWRVLKPGGELLLADATSDGTPTQVKNFYKIARLPKLFAEPASRTLYKFMIRPARPLKMYQQIAAELAMPPGTVTQVPNLPVFLFRTQKPASTERS